MDRALKRIITLNAWFVFLHYFTSKGMSVGGEHVGRKISEDNHPGFISIDCGEYYDYVDNGTDILYQRDEDFVETGTNQMVSQASAGGLQYKYFGRQLQTLRSFPVGTRNCYTLKPKQGKNGNYLIRAFFAYGNYDGKNQNSTFDLYLGVNRWDKIVRYNMYNDYQFSELVHTPSTDAIDVCLVQTGPTIPFISSLELRPFNSSIYQISTSPVWLLQQYDVGAPDKPLDSRYKDDKYDRMWHNYIREDWYTFSTSADIDSVRTRDAYALPLQVWKTAAQSSNVSSDLKFDSSNEPLSLDESFNYRVYFHFVEIVPGQTRIINISLNGKNILSKPLALEYLKPVTIISPENAIENYVNFSISAARESNAPPMLNAFEIYKLQTRLSSPTDTRDVNAIMAIKSAYKISKLNWQGDPCVPKQYAWEGLICSSDITPRITSLNLSSSKLTGKIAIAFSNLTEIVSLDLSYNDLVGRLPEFLVEMPKLKTLLDDNPDLCMEDSCDKRNFIIPLVASIVALIVVLSISLGIWIFKRRKQVVHSEPKEGSLKARNRAFSYVEVLSITDNFKNIIGEGGFRKVYLGKLQDGNQVAVKLLSQSSMQGYKEFRAEAQLLMIIHHRNLVSLIGYCDEGEIKALIYEYMVNGNLQQHLSENDLYVLKWNERLKIAVDAAQGLDYLHNGCRPPLVHRDLKTSNILLNENMQAKIADFGLCRAFVSDTDSHVSTCPAGTPGYVDPEIGNSNKKSDIYSFEIILFELITGHPAVARSHEKFVHILQYAIPIVERGDIKNVVDSRLQGEFNTNSAWKAVEIALSCISPTAAERPDISHILMELKECLSLQMVQTYMNRSRNILQMTTLQFEYDTTPLAR